MSIKKFWVKFFYSGIARSGVLKGFKVNNIDLHLVLLTTLASYYVTGDYDFWIEQMRDASSFIIAFYSGCFVDKFGLDDYNYNGGLINRMSKKRKVDKLSQPHARTFEYFFKEKETAKSLLKEYLPEKIRKKLDFNTLKISNDSFMDKKLKDYFVPGI